MIEHKHTYKGVEYKTADVCGECKDGWMTCNNGSEEYELPCPGAVNED